jgi:hypothetical protein
MTSGIGERAKLVLQMIQLIPAMDTRVIEELESAATAHSSCIVLVESAAAHFGILPRLSDIQPHEYLKWIQILRFICHPDKHGQSIVGVQNATRLFSIIDQCFQQHRNNWVERATQYVRTDTQHIDRSRADASSVAADFHVRTPKSTYQTTQMNAETLRRFRQAAFEADILDVESLSVLRRVEDRHRVIDALRSRQYTDSDDEDLSDSSFPENWPALTVEADGTQPASDDTCLRGVVDLKKRGDGSALEMKPEAYMRICSDFYNRQVYLSNWVDRVRHPETGTVVYEVNPCTKRKTNKLPARGRITYNISMRHGKETTTRMPPPPPGSISNLDFEGDANHVDALIRCTLYMLGSDQGVSDRTGPWSVYNFMLTFFERIRAVAIANVNKIDVLALYNKTSIDQACRVLWSIVQMDPVQFPYMLYAMQWVQRMLSDIPEVPELHLYTDYKYTSWIDDICVMIDGTLEHLATQAITANVSIGHVFRLDTNGLARLLERLVQATALPVYYTRMVDKMLLIIGRQKHTSALRQLHHLLSDNRTQLEEVLYVSEFDIQSIAGYDVGIDDILLLVETIFEELLPEGGLGGMFTDSEARVW